MTTPRVTGSSERERRDLVSGIAQRGRAAYTARDQAVQPSVDYTAAAQAAVAGDPVDLNEAQMAALGAGVEGAQADTARFAEAQRAIFDRGRGREEAYRTTALGPDQDALVEGLNTELDRYASDLQKAEAAARAARSRGSSRRSSSGSGFSFDPNLFDEAPPDADLGDPDAAGRILDRGQMVVEFGPQTAELMDEGFRVGISLDELAEFAINNFAETTDIHPNSIADYVQGLRGSYANYIRSELEALADNLRREGADQNLVAQWLQSRLEAYGVVQAPRNPSTVPPAGRNIPF